MRFGNLLKPGDVILAKVQFTDTYEVKIRPAVILFEEFGNMVIAGITSNTKMQGIPLTVKEGAIQESVIKTNYLFTISEKMINKFLFHLNSNKKRILYQELVERLENLAP